LSDLRQLGILTYKVNLVIVATGQQLKICYRKQNDNYNRA